MQGHSDFNNGSHTSWAPCPTHEMRATSPVSAGGGRVVLGPMLLAGDLSHHVRLYASPGMTPVDARLDNDGLPGGGNVVWPSIQPMQSVHMDDIPV